jgi:DNA-binding beta-propeller fold protein YncE
MKNIVNNLKLSAIARLKPSAVILFVGIALILVYSSNAPAGIETSFAYYLSDFDGAIPINTANFSVDEQRKEIYVVDHGQGVVRVFNRSGMEVYQFGEDGELGEVFDIAVREDGNMFVLTKGSPQPSLVLCDFRGKPLSTLALKNLPPDFSGFTPYRMVYRRGLLYLLDLSSMRIVVADSDGRFQKGYDAIALMGVAEEKRGATEIAGFNVDREGNILFTVPVLFRAYRLTPEGKLTGFGTPGSAPGKFNIAAGIVSDNHGYYYVADRLKSAIIVFDKNFDFVTEFGFRGPRPGNLIAPKNLALDVQGRLYVSQLANRGISVFNITHTPQQAETREINR